ncbi:NUDIX domain-containing protein [Streptomyces nondiastaticus]|uniref:NUDIX domain-containing protein n=1 Tax=Streptomyces nondiastaticus TaxID=3154512 RepID=A0ABW6TT03_9ACTN
MEQLPETIDYVDANDHVVAQGPRGQAPGAGLHRRAAATILLAQPDGPGRHVLIYQRPSTACVYPGHHDVLIGGSPRAGESYRQAAARELAEELGIHPPLREALRLRTTSPLGPYHLTVHLAELCEPLRPDPREIPRHELLPLARVLAVPPRPFVPTGLDVLRRLFT